MPTDPWAGIDKSEEMWSAIDTEHTRTSVPTPAEMARARFKDPRSGLTRRSPEYAKFNPPTATEFQGPFGDYGYDTKLQEGQGLLSSIGQALNPFSWVAPPMGELLTPTNPVSTSNLGNPWEAKPGHPDYNPTMLNLPSRLASTVVPDFAGTAKESYRRGEAGESTKDMYGPPIAMAGMLGMPKTGRAILPKDVAAETATRASRGALGSDASSFKHGATPDIAILQDLEGGTVTRSQGRLLKKIQASKELELKNLEKDLDVPGHSTEFTNPMDSIQPVLDDARSRAAPTEAVRIGEFNSLLSNKINALSKGTMQLNPSQIVQLKRWVDGFINVYRDETVGTMKDLAQNTYSALRKHLDKVAPEATERSQRIQSLIQAEEDLHSKIYSKTPQPHTMWGEAKNAIGTVFPTTLAQTSAAALFKLLSGGELERGALPGALSLPPIKAEPVPPAPVPPAPKLLSPPSGVTVTPQGTSIPNPALTSGMASGIPEAPGRVGTPAFKSGAPTITDPYNTAINAGQEYLGELRSGRRPSGIQPPPEATPASIPPTTAPSKATTPTSADVNVDLKAAVEIMRRNGITPPESLTRVISEIDSPGSTRLPLEPKPSHVTEGTRVSAHDEAGNLVSGNLERLYPAPGPEGNIIWKGTILDVAKGKTIDLPADIMFDALTGPLEIKSKAVVSTITQKITDLYSDKPFSEEDLAFYEKKFKNQMKSNTLNREDYQAYLDKARRQLGVKVQRKIKNVTPGGKQSESTFNPNDKSIIDVTPRKPAPGKPWKIHEFKPDKGKPPGTEPSSVYGGGPPEDWPSKTNVRSIQANKKFNRQPTTESAPPSKSFEVFDTVTGKTHGFYASERAAYKITKELGNRYDYDSVPTKPNVVNMRDFKLGVPDGFSALIDKILDKIPPKNTKE